MCNQPWQLVYKTTIWGNTFWWIPFFQGAIIGTEWPKHQCKQSYRYSRHVKDNETRNKTTTMLFFSGALNVDVKTPPKLQHEVNITIMSFNIVSLQSKLHSRKIEYYMITHWVNKYKSIFKTNRQYYVSSSPITLNAYLAYSTYQTPDMDISVKDKLVSPNGEENMLVNEIIVVIIRYYSEQYINNRTTDFTANVHVINKFIYFETLALANHVYLKNHYNQRLTSSGRSLKCFAIVSSETTYMMTYCMEIVSCLKITKDDVIKWKHFPRYVPFAWSLTAFPLNMQDKWVLVFHKKSFNSMCNVMFETANIFRMFPKMNKHDKGHYSFTVRYIAMQLQWSHEIAKCHRVCYMV